MKVIAIALLTASFWFSQSAMAQEKSEPQPATKPAAEGQKTSEIPEGMTVYYMGLLSRGPKWTPEKTAETAKIQEQHMAHIRSMGESGKLVIAGPFLDGGQLRGIFVFKVSTLEEARAMAEADPAVKAGRLQVEIHPWMVDKGILP